MPTETGHVSEAEARGAIWDICADLEIDPTPLEELALINAYQRGVTTGFLKGIDFSASAILEGVTDGITFARDQLKKVDNGAV